MLHDPEETRFTLFAIETNPVPGNGTDNAPPEAEEDDAPQQPVEE